MELGTCQDVVQLGHVITKKCVIPPPHPWPFVTRFGVHVKLLSGLNPEISKVRRQHPGLWPQMSERVIWAWPPPISGGTLQPIPSQYHLSTLFMSSVNQELYVISSRPYIPMKLAVCHHFTD